MHNVTLKKQRGTTLIVALSILLVLTILGVSALSTSSLEERMAGNNRDFQVAFEAAETALRAAEMAVEGLANTSAFGSTTGYHAAGVNASGFEPWQIESNWGTQTVPVTISMQTSQQPEFMIQLLTTDFAEEKQVGINNYGESFGQGKITVFKITARGYGQSPNSRVMLQSVYGKRI